MYWACLVHARNLIHASLSSPSVRPSGPRGSVSAFDRSTARRGFLSFFPSSSAQPRRRRRRLCVKIRRRSCARGWSPGRPPARPPARPPGTHRAMLGHFTGRARPSMGGRAIDGLIFADFRTTNPLVVQISPPPARLSVGSPPALPPSLSLSSSSSSSSSSSVASKSVAAADWTCVRTARRRRASPGRAWLGAALKTNQ